jgi:hypothetical protein
LFMIEIHSRDPGSVRKRLESLLFRPTGRPRAWLGDQETYGFAPGDGIFAPGGSVLA